MIKHVADFLDISVQKFPNKLAFIEGDKNITYAEFDEFSDKLASKILEFGFKNSPILILLPKGIDCLISFFGVAKSGNFYTLLDEKSPKERILKVIEILKPKLIISSKDYKFDFGLAKIFVENFNDFIIDKSSLIRARREHIDTNLLYVFFTSGSTGTPKGVSKTHKGLINFIFWYEDEFKIGKDDIIANQAQFYFDASARDIFISIKAGAILHIIPNNLFVFPKKIISYLEKNHITIISWMPSVLIYFANSNALKENNLKNLRFILFVGEIMPNKQLNIWRQNLPWVNFVNLYGSTEIAGVCSYYICDRDFKDDELLPIGKSRDNIELLIFDENLQLILSDEVGKKGELCVRGTGLSAGYYGDLEKTAKVFIQNPLHNNYEDKIYRTGDIVSYNERGEILCHGRADNQIKIRGNRVELGEIESIINAHKEVLNSVCIFKDNKIKVFYEAKNELNLKNYLKDKLPDYMIPRKFIKVEKFALNKNGKIDRKLLTDF